MNRPVRINPEFKALIPPLSPEEHNQLEQNILAHGCRDPIVLWRDTIIDGHNRYEICTKHDIKYKTIKLRLSGRDEAKLWILENQLGRRNITDAMRIELAALKIAHMGQATYVNKAIAEAAHVSEKTVYNYMQIKTKGDPELLQKVLTGEVKIGTAHRGIEVISTRMEELPHTPPTPEEKASRCTKIIMNNVRQIELFYLFHIRNNADMHGIPEESLCAHGRQLVKLRKRVADNNH